MIYLGVLLMSTTPSRLADTGRCLVGFPIPGMHAVLLPDSGICLQPAAGWNWEGFLLEMLAMLLPDAATLSAARLIAMLMRD